MKEAALAGFSIQRGRAALRASLAAACLGSGVWLAVIWAAPIGPELPRVETLSRAGSGARAPARLKRAVHATGTRDIFSDSLSLGLTATHPAAASEVPGLKLLGTVIHDGGSEAILDYPGAGPVAAVHRTGDYIGGFIIKEIREDAVILQRGGETIKVSLDPAGPPDARPVAGRKPRMSSDVVIPEDVPLGLLPVDEESIEQGILK